ncbi:carbon storage regulator [Sphingobium yanoikuyae]|uniref:Carbon storage regulator n=1 Tax=Sphingobium yanoikuyae TaxID=13690 RepID=A0A3G2UMQ2_SPHYA|nr:carbon storage regulator [Sphingobium yanoikuyae]AYO76440.1 hypothetical protein EBF16_05465 [Sphingobium yanoikuyae]
MLKLDVRVGESVEIGDGVVLTLEKKSGQLARIAIRADPGLKIRRMPGLPGIPVQTQS